MLQTGGTHQLNSVSYHGTVNELQAMNCAAASPFDRAEWFALLANEAGRKPVIAIAKNAHGMAALPLMQAGGVVGPLANWYAFTWRPLVNGSPNKLELLGIIASQLRQRAFRVTMSPVPDEDGSASLLRDAFADAGWQTEMTKCDDNHVLHVNGRTYAEYIARRPGQLRTTLKRKAGKVTVEILAAFDAGSWSDYEDIYQRSWKPEEGNPALLRQFAEDEGALGRIRLGIARLGGTAIAAQFWTVESGTAYIHKLAHLEEHKQLSAGTVLTAALFEHVIDRDGVEMIDFGTGSDRYKADWMEDIRPRYRIDCLNPSDPRSWPALVKRAIRRLAPARHGG
ncbi:GNAT family N-acetyltransferase [Altererythrobacter aquiaggeris]|uniref:GNAT family N-acetyltransferase n=1 Tax=Aestuarierythrobacter aquiaggeris TaxID=1898396 RepID=UPI00301A157F